MGGAGQVKRGVRDELHVDASQRQALVMPARSEDGGEGQLKVSEGDADVLKAVEMVVEVGWL